MANVIRGNKIFVDTTGTILSNTRVKIAYIIFTASAGGDSVTFKEASSDNEVLHFHGATANQTTYFDFSNAPAVFNNGLHVTISSGAKCTIITTNSGGN